MQKTLSLISFACLIPSTLSACSGDGWTHSYSPDKCRFINGNIREIICPERVSGTCGTRLENSKRLGQGTYSASMRAASGSGLNTAFYLYSYNRKNDQTRPWNEIDFEFLGGPNNGIPKLWTNIWTGFKVQHGQFVSLSFDPRTSFHSYTIKIDNKYVYWLIDGRQVRRFDYSRFSDFVRTVNTKDFQGNIALWGQADNSWPDLGPIWKNNQPFPQKAYFKDLTLTTGNGGNSRYVMIKSSNGKCLDADSNTWNKSPGGGKVQLWTCNGWNNQKWIIKDGIIKSFNGKCLDADSGSWNKYPGGGKVQLWNCNGWNNQKWSVSGVSIIAGNGKCFDADSGSWNKNPGGGKVQLWNCNGWSNQKWRVERV